MEELIETIGQTAFIVIMVIITLYDKINKFLKERKKHKQDRVEYGISTTKEIYRKIIEGRVEFDANRISVCQLHNGDYYANKSPILKISMTHEVTDVTTVKIIKDEQNILVSKYPDFFDSLIKNDIVVYSDITNMEAEGIVEDFKYKGIKSFYATKLTNKEGEMIGFLSLAFTDIVTKKIDEKLFIEYGKNISYLLKND